MVSVTPGARPGYGFDINATGDISASVDFDAVRITGAGIEDISGGLLGVTTGEAINASGQVAISQELNNANDVWRWTPGVGLQDLGIDSDDERVVAHGINADGDVVGLGQPIGSDNIRAGFLYRDGLGPVDLNDLLTGKGVKNWFIAEAWDINDSGQIVADALNLRTFQSQAVRLDPVP
jgi:probable HAF family extracellular repeat protein